MSAGVNVSAESMKNKKRVVTLVTVVTLMFSISWLPIQLILLLKSNRMYKVTILNISIQVNIAALCVNKFLDNQTIPESLENTLSKVDK